MRRSPGVIKTKGSNGAIRPIKINLTIGLRLILSIDRVPETEIMLQYREDGVVILNGITTNRIMKKEKSKVVI